MAGLDFGKTQFQGRPSLGRPSFVEVDQTVPVGKPKLRILEAISRRVSFDANCAAHSTQRVPLGSHPSIAIPPLDQSRLGGGGRYGGSIGTAIQLFH